MLMLEALSALWFWTHFGSVLAMPQVSEPVLPAVRASETTWDTPREAWSDALAAASWKRHWRAVTGCCTDFVYSPIEGACSGRVRLVQAKSLPDGDGWRMAFVVTACG